MRNTTRDASRQTGDQMPSLIKSASKCRDTHTNSPASVRRTYKLELYGSTDSVLPKICDVDAVGMGATSKLLRTPHLAGQINQSLNIQESTRHTDFSSQRLPIPPRRRLDIPEIKLQ